MGHMYRSQDTEKCITHNWYPWIFTWGGGFLSESNPDKWHCCYTADHPLTPVTVLTSLLYVFQALALCCNSRCICCKLCWNRSWKSLKRFFVLAGLVLECMVLWIVYIILFSLFLFFPILIKWYEDFHPFFPQLGFTEVSWPYVKR